MKRTFLLALCVAVTLLLPGCGKKTGPTTSDALSEVISDMHQDDIRQIFGEPTMMLSGFWGDGYVMDNGTQMFFYYGDDGSVRQVAVMDGQDIVTWSLSFWE